MDIGFNNIQTLNLSGLLNLKNLYCYYNGLITLDVSEQINLENLSCGWNGIGELNLTGLSQLKYLDCGAQGEAYISNPNTFGLKLNSLILSGNTSLNVLNCEYNNLTTLTLDSSLNLTLLNCSVNNLTSLDTSGLIYLTGLSCNRNQLSSLNVNGSTNLNSLNCDENQLPSLNVSGLTNLYYLLCNDNQIQSLNVSGTINLYNLFCYNNQLTSLNVNGLANLKNIDCHNNLITSLDVSGLTGLVDLNCNNNQLTSLNVNGLSNLQNLRSGNNQLSNLDLSGLTNLYYFICSDNNLTNIDLSGLTNLGYFFCSGNEISSIDVSGLTNLTRLFCDHNQISTLDVSELTQLVRLYCNNNQLTSLFMKNNNFESYLEIEDNPNLTYICADEIQLVSIQDQLTALGYSNCQVNSYCSFNPGGNYNTITGTFSLDNDNNGCDVNDYKMYDVKIKIDDVSAIFNATYTNTTGNYNFFTQSGNFIITPEFENPYFTVSPTSATITFADSNNNIQTQNFCVTPNGIHNDVEVSVLPILRPRPGFDATYQLTYKNKGNQVLSGNVNLAFNDAVLDFVVANPAVSAQSLNTLSWSYSNLLPFESRTIHFTLNVNSPQEIPAVNIGDFLSFSASIDPISGDETVNDNTFALTQTVFGSYDPNDKTCLEGNTIVPERIGEYLHYLIRFQNSGTAAAENIVVKDIIDTTKFDVTSLQLTSASHDYKTKITGNKVEFIFENINLPAEIDNEAASHGFVAFKIKTKNNLTAGNSVSNKADIYFDYNFPITTNEATTTFATLGVNQIENKSVAVFPNPVNDILTITSKGNLTSIQLLDVQGRLIATYLESEEKATINLSDKASGVYFVKIFTENGVKLEKIVKK